MEEVEEETGAFLDEFLSSKGILIRKDAVHKDIKDAVSLYLRNFRPDLEFFSEFWKGRKYSLWHIIFPFKDHYEGRRDLMTFMYSKLWDIISKWNPYLPDQEKQLASPLTALFFIYGLYKTQPPSVTKPEGKILIYTEVEDYALLIKLYSYFAKFRGFRRSGCYIIRKLVKEDAFIVSASRYRFSSTTLQMDEEDEQAGQQKLNMTLSMLARDKQAYDGEIQRLSYLEKYQDIQRSEEAYASFKARLMESGDGEAPVIMEGGGGGDPQQLWPIQAAGFINNMLSSFNEYEEIVKSKANMPIDYIGASSSSSAAIRKGRKRKARTDLIRLNTSNPGGLPSPLGVVIEAKAESCISSSSSSKTTPCTKSPIEPSTVTTPTVNMPNPFFSPLQQQ